MLKQTREQMGSGGGSSSSSSSWSPSLGRGLGTTLAPVRELTKAKARSPS